MKAYLSSTYSDLVEHRRAAAHALRSLQLQVSAMEESVARDERPLDQCLADVEASGLYVGLFAFRYGYVPALDNPEGMSITELEYRRARSLGIPCLLFIVPEDAPWPRNFDDRVTGEGERGDRIAKLRTEILKTRLVETFTTPDQLDAAVSKAAALQVYGPHPVSADHSRRQPIANHPRLISQDILIVHSPSDRDDGVAIAEALRSVNVRVGLSNALQADTPSQIVHLDRSVASARATALLISPATLTVLRENTQRASRVLSIMRDRTGVLFGLTKFAIDPSEVPQEVTEVIAPKSQSDPTVSSLASRLRAALYRHAPLANTPEIGLPVVVAAMTDTEAHRLFANPPALLVRILAQSEQSADDWMARYTTNRFAWLPFVATSERISDILASSIEATNQLPYQLKGRAVRLQRYPLDPLLTQDLLHWPVYTEIAQSGCLVVVDELSMLLDDIREAIVQSPLSLGKQVSFVTLSPADPAAGTPWEDLGRELQLALSHVASRFSEGFDPLCELGVPEKRRFDRWLRTSVPRTIDAMQQPLRDDSKLNAFAAELGTVARHGMARLIAGDWSAS